VDLAASGGDSWAGDGLLTSPALAGFSLESPKVFLISWKSELLSFPASILSLISSVRVDGAGTDTPSRATFLRTAVADTAVSREELRAEFEAMEEDLPAHDNRWPEAPNKSINPSWPIYFRYRRIRVKI
jgi:hypothetical protein